MINQAQILGRIGKIETKDLSSGTKVTNMSIVTSKKFTKNGEKQEEVTWHNITAFGKLAEIAEKYVFKGDLLWIQGEMKNQKYQAQDGTEKVKFFVMANDIRLMPKSKEHKAEPKTDSYDGGFDDSEIPF